ncbi:MAG TPA: trypsin-like peptidase domain-containing protein [Marmoricola sp.]|nr:trypsin-like peptidase domain-containing protein [Marmoricola sp.]
MPDQAGTGTCHWCGHPLDRGVCPHCDRPRDTWLARLSARLHLHDDFWLPVLAAFAIVVAIGVIGVMVVRIRSGADSTTAAPGPQVRAGSGATDTASASAAARPGSTFTVLGSSRDESGRRTRVGYAFVIRSGPESSDLLTDYNLVVERYAEGDRTADVANGEESFRATIVAVSPDPHVALLRVGGRFPALPIAPEGTRPGDTVLVGEDGEVAAPRATVVAHIARGRPSHITFTIPVDGRDDGTPVLDLRGRVVGIAEPSAPFGTDRLGFAIPIMSGCVAVHAC